MSSNPLDRVAIAMIGDATDQIFSGNGIPALKKTVLPVKGGECAVVAGVALNGQPATMSMSRDPEGQLHIEVHLQGTSCHKECVSWSLLREAPDRFRVVVVNPSVVGLAIVVAEQMSSTLSRVAEIAHTIAFCDPGEHDLGIFARRDNLRRKAAALGRVHPLAKDPGLLDLLNHSLEDGRLYDYVHAIQKRV